MRGTGRRMGASPSGDLTRTSRRNPCRPIRAPRLKTRRVSRVPIGRARGVDRGRFLLSVTPGKRQRNAGLHPRRMGLTAAKHGSPRPNAVPRAVMIGQPRTAARDCGARGRPKQRVSRDPLSLRALSLGGHAAALPPQFCGKPRDCHWLLGTGGPTRKEKVSTRVTAGSVSQRKSRSYQTPRER